MLNANAYYDAALPWTGRADLLRSQRAGVALVTELGRNYDQYHDDLAERVAAIGRPDPDNYPRLRSYLEDWSKVQAIVRAEHLLRVARGVVNGQRPSPLTDSAPLVSADDRLLHADEAANLSPVVQAPATSR